MRLRAARKSEIYEVFQITEDVEFPVWFLERFPNVPKRPYFIGMWGFTDHDNMVGLMDDKILKKHYDVWEQK